ncbi:uncharacterized protein A4U43_C05F8440 [Asparagus officinalis]|uniref:Uncharacterized protein n=1 Tax=Asparagus officinalis TaxID=4686 RepID=A0A5P1EQ96_ASPOF|nr:uncharacterized protein LOC109843748 isoform X2 [Asparagus officinalis]ONK68178.1 uncharacterized protein A4U43_C05F8440 [Asparagus officinalis]
MESTDLLLPGALPRVLIVSRRTVRKNKFVDFVGEYHLDLIVRYGAVPVIVPRVSGIHTLLESFEPIHGVLLCEGEDVDPSLYDVSGSELSPDELEHVRSLHTSDTVIDHEKDSIELRLTRLCLERTVPFLGICRGSQVLNVASGGTLYQDVEKELAGKRNNDINTIKHIDYNNYDGHRHKVSIIKNTPLHHWFSKSLEGEGENMEIMVNSYHHQGVKRLGPRFVPMAFAPDGLVEGFYDPDVYNPDEGKFIVGLQFHPERMRMPENDEFDYPGCPLAYQEFVKAVISYWKKTSTCTNPRSTTPKLDQEMEKRRKIIIQSFCVAKDIYTAKFDVPSSKGSEHEAGAEFVKSRTALSLQQEKRLKQMGATVRNASSYMEGVRKNEARGIAAQNVMERMSIEQLSELLSFYHKMGKICSDVLKRKISDSLDTMIEQQQQ